MSAQRPLVALIAGSLCSFVLAGAMVIGYADLAYPTALIIMSVIAALLVTVLAGSVLVIATGGGRVPRDRSHTEGIVPGSV